jgi:hypothetical protein
MIIFLLEVCQTKQELNQIHQIYALTGPYLWIAGCVLFLYVSVQMLTGIKKGQKHAIKALTNLQIVEVQMGDRLVEEDILRFDWEW